MFCNYGICILIGIFFSFLSIYFLNKNYENKAFCWDTFFKYFLWIYIGAFIGGKLFFYFFDESFDFRSIKEFIVYGFSIFGATVGGILATLILFKNDKNRQPFLKYIPGSVLLIHALGRIGCYFGGCCGGRSLNIFDYEIPFQCSVSFYFLVVFIIYLICIKYKNLRNYLFSLRFYLSAVSFERFLFDFWRDDSIYVPSVYMTKYQLISLIVFVVVHGTICMLKYKKVINFNKNN
jgi:phosphatidylglycerol:prolipoprotein diacylglycerol transferase